jgi:hypothetical protein
VKSLYVVLFLLANAALSVADEHPRIFITDSKSWEVSGGAGGSSGGFGAATKGGDRPQTAEIIKTFNERCPLVIVNNKQDKADYVVLLDHEGGKDAVSRDNKVVIFNREGDAIMSHSTRSLGNAVKDACEVITRNWSGQRARARYSESQAAPQPAAANKN